MSISVLLADDSDVMRRAIVHLLQTAPDIRILGEGSSFAQTMKLASQLHPQVTVFDMHMDDGVSMAPEVLKSGLAGSCLLAMSIWNDDETKSLAKTMGAEALLDKATLGAELENVPTVDRGITISTPKALPRQIVFQEVEDEHRPIQMARSAWRCPA